MPNVFLAVFLLTLSQMINFRLFQTVRVCRRQFQILPNCKSLQTTISNLMTVAESYPNGKLTLREKEKLLITSNFSFSHSVFKTLILQTHKNKGLFGKGLTLSQMPNFGLFQTERVCRQF